MKRLFPRTVWSIVSAMGIALVIAVSLNPNRFLPTTWRSRYSVQDRLDEHGAHVRQRLEPMCAAASLNYPPDQIAILAFKDTKIVELYGLDNHDHSWRPITTYPILGSSGNLGPKLREGDRQVPEGIYRVHSLNPNSRFHLAIRVDYPNDFERQMAVADRRTQLGGDIMIHGGASSIGCLAMGDQAAEDLFVLAALIDIDQVQVVISPTDFRDSTVAIAIPNAPEWTSQLYDRLRNTLESFPNRTE